MNTFIPLLNDCFTTIDAIHLASDAEVENKIQKIDMAVQIAISLLALTLGNEAGQIFTDVCHGTVPLPPRPPPFVPEQAPADAADDNPDIALARKTRNDERRATHRDDTARIDAIHYAHLQLVIHIFRMLEPTNYVSAFQGSLPLESVNVHLGLTRLSNAMKPSSLNDCRISMGALAKRVDTGSVLALTTQFRHELRAHRDRFPGDPEAQLHALPDAVAIHYLYQRMASHRYKKLLASTVDLPDEDQHDLEIILQHLNEHAYLVDDNSASAHVMDHPSDSDTSSHDGDAAVMRARPSKKSPAQRVTKSRKSSAKNDPALYVLKLEPSQIASTKASHLDTTVLAKTRGTPTSTKVYYCWSHGINASHPSDLCERPRKGHQPSATLKDMQGGATHIAKNLRGDP